MFAVGAAALLAIGEIGPIFLGRNTAHFGQA
jgi:hypothetical protein